MGVTLSVKTVATAALASYPRLLPGWARVDALPPLCVAVKAMDYLHQLQWPAIIVTVIAAWLIASQAKRRRKIGFCCFLLSNGLWVVWGWNDRAYAVIVLQIALAILNVRGAYKNEPESNVKSEDLT